MKFIYFHIENLTQTFMYWYFFLNFNKTNVFRFTFNGFLHTFYRLWIFFRYICILKIHAMNFKCLALFYESEIKQV